MGELGLLLTSQGIQLGAQAGNTYSQNQAMRGQSQFDNTMTNINSQWSGIQQNQLLSRGDVAGSRARLQYNDLAGSQRAAFARNGANVNTGSAGIVQGETRALGEIERLELQRQAMNQAVGLRAEDADARAHNRLRKIGTRNNINQGYAALGANAGQAAMRSAYLYDRYRGLDKQNASALDGTISYTPPDLIKPVAPEYDREGRTENA